MESAAPTLLTYLSVHFTTSATSALDLILGYWTSGLVPRNGSATSDSITKRSIFASSVMAGATVWSLIFMSLYFFCCQSSFHFLSPSSTGLIVCRRAQRQSRLLPRGPPPASVGHTSRRFSLKMPDILRRSGPERSLAGWVVILDSCRRPSERSSVSAAKPAKSLTTCTDAPPMNSGFFTWSMSCLICGSQSSLVCYVSVLMS